MSAPCAASSLQADNDRLRQLMTTRPDVGVAVSSQRALNTPLLTQDGNRTVKRAYKLVEGLLSPPNVADAAIGMASRNLPLGDEIATLHHCGFVIVLTRRLPTLVVRRHSPRVFC